MTIHQLYVKIYSDHRFKDPQEFIDIYETNKELIEGLPLNGDKEVYRKITRLTGDYAHHLTTREYYKKALPKIDKAIELFELNPDYIGTDLFKHQLFEALVFDRAVSNYYLKNYKEAKSDLRILKDRFPDNDKYQNWLNSLQTFSIRALINVCWYVVAGAMLVTMLFDEKEIGILRDIILFVGIIALIIAVTADLKSRFAKRK
jgi:hypothetical protein